MFAGIFPLRCAGRITSPLSRARGLRRTSRCSRELASRFARRRRGRESSRCRPLRASRRRRADRGRGGALNPAHADDRDRDARGDGRDLGERDGADRWPREPPVPPPSHGLRRRAACRGVAAGGRERHRAQRVDQRDGVGAAGLAASAHAATSAALGVSLTISGLRVARAHGAHDAARAGAGSAPMSRPVSTFGQETFSSIAAISRAASQAPAARDLRRRSSPSRS